MKDLEHAAVADTTSLMQTIQDRLIAYIKDNALEPGDRLPSETELAATIGVSRSMVREALRGLETIGLIRVQKGSGRYLRRVVFSEVIHDLAYTLEVSSADLIDLLEIRAALEIQFVEKAIQIMEEDDLHKLEDILLKIETKMRGGGRSFAREDMEFHRLIFHKVDNQLLQELLTTFWKLFIETLPEKLKLPARTDVILQHHTDLLEAIKRKNGKQARHLLTDHFTDVIDRLQ